MRDTYLPACLLAPLVASLLVVGCGSPSAHLPAPTSENPLPACPSSPNCERTSRPYNSPADTLFTAAREALGALGPSRLRVSPDSMRASAVYRVALLFKDDMDVAVTAATDSSVLHVRSASRVGYDDLGMNRRRVARFFRAVERALP